MNIRRLAQWLDLTTIARYRPAALGSIASAAETGSAFVVTILSVALTVPYLGPNRFGIWMTIASLAGMLSLFDLGVGNSLISRIAQANLSDKKAEVNEAVAGGLALVTLIGLVSSFVLIAIVLYAPWQQLLIRSDGSAAIDLDETQKCAYLFAVFFGFYQLSAAVKKIYLGLQRVYVAHSVAVIANFVSILALLVAARFEANIPYLLVVTFGVTSIAPLILIPGLLMRSSISVTGVWEALKAEVKNNLNASMLFFLIQAGILINNASDPLILSAIIGPAAVSIYTVASKPFQVLLLPQRVIVGPLWAAYSDAHARSDWKFIRQTLRLHFVMSLIYGVVALVVVTVVHGFLVKVWTSGTIEVSMTLTFALAIGTLVEMSLVPLVTFMNGCGKIRAQAYSTYFSLITFLPMKLVAAYAFGLVGLICTNFVFLIIITLVFYFWLFRRDIFSPLFPQNA